MEGLRLHPSVPKDIKFAVEDDRLPDGTIIRKGQAAFYSPYAMGRDPTLWCVRLHPALSTPRARLPPCSLEPHLSRLLCPRRAMTLLFLVQSAAQRWGGGRSLVCCAVCCPLCPLVVCMASMWGFRRLDDRA